MPVLNMENGSQRLTEVIEKHGTDYITYIREVPGVNTQGATIEEARANLREAFDLIKLTRQEMSEPM